MSSSDEILFGGGASVPVRRDGTETGELFFLAEDTVLVSEFDLVSTTPMQMPGEDGARTYYVCTFRGRKNGEKGLSAVTLLLTYGGIRALTAGLRTKMAETPTDQRIMDSGEGMSGSITIT